MADPPWLPGCKENLAKIPNAVLCSEQHCLDTQTYNHMVCHCTPPYNNGCPQTNPPPGCCSYTDTSPVPVFTPAGTCYCCCGCFANDTQVAYDDASTKPIKDFLVGDMVLVAKNIDLSEWEQLPVAFSSGTGSESSSTMIQVSFGNDEAHLESVIATRDQLFLLPGQKFKRTSKLVPGLDSLIRKDGSQALVQHLTAGTFMTGVHQIATSSNTTTNPDGHLLLANGVVCGDYSLQITNLDEAAPNLMVAGHADLPEFGTRLYAERHAHLFADTTKAHSASKVYRPVASGGFEPFEVEVAPFVPTDTTSFITQQQAEDIENAMPPAPIYSGVGRDINNYLFKLFKGFYPQVSFYLDEANQLPNAYSFYQYGVPFVVVNGGLIRTAVIQYESLAFVIAHQLSVLYGGEPKGEDGYTCRGQADYAAILAIFPYVWFGMYAFPMMKPAIDQITRLFALIKPENRGGQPGNTCNMISTDCRLSAMNAGATTQPLPECAGGPPTPTLAVTGAVAGESGKTVTISFNEAVDPTTADDSGNYEFSPLTGATGATVSGDAKSVMVTASFTPDTEYTVRVVDVTSADGHPIIPSQSRATFKTPAVPPTTSRRR